MRKKWFKKGSAVLLAAAMVLSLFPGMKGTLATVQAAENETPTSGYWTDVAGLKNFSLDEANDTEGKIIFGQNGSGAAQQWKIAGVDSGIKDAKGNVTEKDLLDAAAAENVKVYGMSENMVASAADKATVLLGFGSMDEADMKEGLRRLQNAWL